MVIDLTPKSPLLKKERGLVDEINCSLVIIQFLRIELLESLGWISLHSVVIQLLRIELLGCFRYQSGHSVVGD
jgi:hypothetical protein